MPGPALGSELGVLTEEGGNPSEQLPAQRGCGLVAAGLGGSGGEAGSCRPVKSPRELAAGLLWSGILTERRGIRGTGRKKAPPLATHIP